MNLSLEMETRSSRGICLGRGNGREMPPEDAIEKLAIKSSFDDEEMSSEAEVEDPVEFVEESC